MSFDADFANTSDLLDSLNDIEPNTATYRRRVIIILLDLSGSMGLEINPPGDRTEAAATPETGSADTPADAPAAADTGATRLRRIDVLNDRLRSWLPMIREEGKGRLRDVEIAVISFNGNGVRALTGPRDAPSIGSGAFVPAAALDFGELESFGTTPMVEAVRRALELAEARARELATRSVQTGYIRILMFSDGGPSDRDLPKDAWRQAAAEVAAARERKLVQFFSFGAPGAKENVLRALAGPEGHVQLAEFNIDKLLDLILLASSAADPFQAIREELEWDQH